MKYHERILDGLLPDGSPVIFDDYPDPGDWLEMREDFADHDSPVIGTFIVDRMDESGEFWHLRKPTRAEITTRYAIDEPAITAEKGKT